MSENNGPTITEEGHFSTVNVPVAGNAKNRRFVERRSSQLLAPNRERE